MLRFVATIIILLFCYSVSAQTNQEFEIFVNGNLEKIVPGKKNIFITSKGDTIVYMVDDIIKEMVKDQPKVTNTGATATNYKEPESEPEQEKSEISPVSVDKTEVVKPVVKQETVELQKQEKVSVEATQQNVIQTPPEVSAKTEVAKEVPKQNTPDLAEIERLKEEARKKIKGNINEAQVKPAPETKSPSTIIVEPEKRNISNEKVDQLVKTEKAAVAVQLEKKSVITEKSTKPVQLENIAAAGVVEVEQKKVAEEKNVRYVNKKYYLEDRAITSANISSSDTLKFLATFLSAYKDFPSLQFGSEGEFSLCYNYVVKMYNGYDEDLVEKNSSVYRICHSGKWNDGKKTAEVYMETNSGRTKITYSIVQLDDKNLVLVKR